jgi:hypothetical protein
VPGCGSRLSAGRDLRTDRRRQRVLVYCSDPEGDCAFTERHSPGEGLPRLIKGNAHGGDTATGRCPACGRSVRWRADGGLAAHEVQGSQCPGSGNPSAEDPALAARLPVKNGLTAPGFRHTHKTWMVEDGIPEILAELRLGHEVPGMRGLYSHVSERERPRAEGRPASALG